MTFLDPAVATVLKKDFVESRLHMDGDDVVPANLMERHRDLQSELIGNEAMPYYAILDPKTDEFLFRTHLRGSDEGAWKQDFLTMFRRVGAE